MALSSRSKNYPLGLSMTRIAGSMKTQLRMKRFRGQRKMCTSEGGLRMAVVARAVGNFSKRGKTQLSNHRPNFTMMSTTRSKNLVVPSQGDTTSHPSGMLKRTTWGGDC